MTRFIKFVKRSTIIFITVFLIIVLLNRYVVALSIVKGTSMYPTLDNGDYLLVNKISKFVSVPCYKDMIIFESPKMPGTYLIKRVVGISGDIITIKGGVLYRNWIKVEEDYVDTLAQQLDFGPVQVLSNTVFVMGDNRRPFASLDSRYEEIGLVPFKQINGKVNVIFGSFALASFL